MTEMKIYMTKAQRTSEWL